MRQLVESLVHKENRAILIAELTSQLRAAASYYERNELMEQLRDAVKRVGHKGFLAQVVRYALVRQVLGCSGGMISAMSGSRFTARPELPEHLDLAQAVSTF